MIICEPICNFNQHVPINVTMIKALVKDENSQVKLLCSNEHWCELRSQIPSDIQKKITHHHIDVVRRGDDWKGWKDSFQLIRYINKLFSMPDEKLVFLSTTSGLLGLSKRYLFKFKTVCILHLLLSRIEGYIPRHPIKSWFSFKKVLLRFTNQNCKIVVLEEHILSNLVKMMPHLEPYTECIQHPLPEDNSNNSLSLDGDFLSKSTFCFPGTFNAEKGAALFCELAERNNDKIKFVVAGKLANDFNIENKEYLFTLPPAKAPLTRDDFSNVINNSHFIFLGHEPKVYEWVASGVYLDALSYEKPIIAQRSNFFEREFNKYGAIGFLFDSIEELEVLLSSQLNKAKYELFQKNIKRAKKGRSIEFNTSIQNILN